MPILYFAVSALEISQPIFKLAQLLAPWTVLALIGWRLWITLRDIVRYTANHHAIPCARCQFFTGDYRLKCTLHPDLAMSERAINCADFCHVSSQSAQRTFENSVERSVR